MWEKYGGKRVVTASLYVGEMGGNGFVTVFSVCGRKCGEKNVLPPSECMVVGKGKSERHTCMVSHLWGRKGELRKLTFVRVCGRIMGHFPNNSVQIGKVGRLMRPHQK